jgi:hypothetical protein
MLSRRLFLVSMLAGAGAACVRPTEREAPSPPSPSSDDTAAWHDQATSLLADTLAALRVCDAYAAYRLSANARGSAEPIWDPPTSSQWTATQQQASGLRERADQLFQTIANARVDASVWRERRAQAAGAHDLIDATDALRAYIDRANHFSPDGDGSGGLDLLKTAWSHWDAAAQPWGLDRTEHITCDQAPA